MLRYLKVCSLHNRSSSPPLRAITSRFLLGILPFSSPLTIQQQYAVAFPLPICSVYFFEKLDYLPWSEKRQKPSTTEKASEAPSLNLNTVKALTPPPAHSSLLAIHTSQEWTDWRSLIRALALSELIYTKQDEKNLCEMEINVSELNELLSKS